MERKNDEGFTLVELLIIIVILVIITIIRYPLHTSHAYYFNSHIYDDCDDE